MTKYHVITVVSSTIEANSPQEAAAKGYQTHRDGKDAERIQVWDQTATPTGGTENFSTMFTFATDPKEIPLKTPGGNA